MKFAKVSMGRAACASLLMVLVGGPAIAEIDPTGTWLIVYHEDWIEIGTGPDIADYAGLPITPQAAQRGLNWHSSLVNVPERQCQQIPLEYTNRWSNQRIWKDIDPDTQELRAYRLRTEWGGLDRWIWMDKRARPPEGALHTFGGFSLGEIASDKLKVTTTHLKEGYTRRNGVPRSDRAKIEEVWMRHGNYLTMATVITDPLYLTEPLVVSTNYTLSLNRALNPFPCESVTELASMAKGTVPHYFPWKNPFLKEFSNKYNIPLQVAMGGAEQMYPSFIEK